MTRRKFSPEHDFWHPRVEGQIKHTMGVHPEWFSVEVGSSKRDCVNSLAKRIVGEIVAATKRGHIPDLNDGQGCEDQVPDADDSNLSRRKGRRFKKCVAAPLSLNWYDARKTFPKSTKKPYLVCYRSGKGKYRVTTAVWAGVDHGWVFLVHQFRSANSDNVRYWAKYPEPPGENYNGTLPKM